MSLFNDFLNSAKDIFKRASPVKQIFIVGCFFVIIFFFIALIYFADRNTYISLMNNLNAEDSTSIIRILRDKKIPFKVGADGKDISIPPESLYELRLELATMGLPQSSVVGYELFDKQSIGTTSFVQKLNQKRAQEGELMRTINTIKGVKRSRVHLALPMKSAFIEDQKKSTASVFLDLEAGFVLTDKQIFGITTLVGRAVEGLDPSDVLVLNSEGKILSKNPNDGFSAITSSQFEYQDKLQRDLERRIETMLGHVVGDGKAVATVTADLDFSQVTETQTTFDPDATAVRSIEKKSDNMSGSRPGPMGTAGNSSNNPNGVDKNNPEIKTSTIKQNEVTNYEVPQTVRKISNSIGKIKRLSVAVVMDEKNTKVLENGKMVAKKEPWTPEELKQFEQVVSSAIGFSLKRGDTIELKSMKFTQEDFEEAQKIIVEAQRRTYINNIIVYSLIGLSILLFFFMVVRPFMKWVIENTSDNVDSFLPQTVEELERLQKTAGIPDIQEVMPVLPDSLDPTKVEGEMIKEKIVTLVDSNPDKAALILKDWIHKKDLEEKDKKANA